MLIQNMENSKNINKKSIDKKVNNNNDKEKKPKNKFKNQLDTSKKKDLPTASITNGIGSSSSKSKTTFEMRS
jgi:hypothetical protein